MIIFGTRGVTYNYKKGDFFCPVCKQDNPYRYKRVRRFFTLYFIPCIPLNKIGEYIECQNCQGTFQADVLEFDPREEQREFEAEFHRAIRQTMVQMVIADGAIEDEEIITVQSIYLSLTQLKLSEEVIRSECASTSPSDIEQLVGGFASTLNGNGKEKVLAAAIRVAASDGDFADEERELAIAIGKALDMSNAHTKGVIAEVIAEIMPS